MAEEPVPSEFAAGEKTGPRPGIAQLAARMEPAVKRGHLYAGLVVALLGGVFGAGLTWGTVARKDELRATAHELRGLMDAQQAVLEHAQVEITANREAIHGITPRLEHIEKSVDWQTEAMFRFFREERLSVTPPPRRATIRP